VCVCVCIQVRINGDRGYEVHVAAPRGDAIRATLRGQDGFARSWKGTSSLVCMSVYVVCMCIVVRMLCAYVCSSLDVCVTVCVPSSVWRRKIPARAREEFCV
jgi:hypothetical protein